MDRPRNILVVIDPSATQHPCLRRARELARAFGARVELFVCCTPGDGELRVDELTLERMAAGLRQEGIDTATDMASDTALHVGIVRKVLRSRPSLVIKDTHPHSLLRRSLIANTDWQLIRLCPAPLLFVRPGVWGHPPRIAAAVDVARPGEKPAQLDHALLTAAESFALATRGLLHAVHAYAPVTELAANATLAAVPMAAGMSAAQLLRDNEETLRSEFDALLSTHRVPRTRRRLTIGTPAEALVRFVRQHDIDLLVMGAYARGWMYNVLVGSTTERVLDLLPCDVLVMKPASFECPIRYAPDDQLPAHAPNARIAALAARL
jgi:universal stress protein E